MICPNCIGGSKSYVSAKGQRIVIPCDICNGSGEVTRELHDQIVARNKRRQEEKEKHLKKD